MKMRHLKSAFGKLLKRKKRNGFYEGADILRAPEKESLLLLGSAIVMPVLIAFVILFINKPV